jgi:hypothetical protein
MDQVFGSGGSTAVRTAFGTVSVTTSWQRFSVTATLPSVSGKTIGTSSYLHVLFFGPGETVQTMDIWGVQVEAGSTATPFQTATGRIQGELAACQRYFQKSYNQSVAPATNTVNGAIFATTSGASFAVFVNPRFPVTMRTAPTMTYYSTDGTINTIRNHSAGTNVTVASVFDIGDSAGGFIDASTSVADQVQIRAQFTASAEL